MNGYNYLDNLLALYFLQEEELVSKKYNKNSMRISYHCWTESLVDLQGRSINSTVLVCFK